MLNFFIKSVLFTFCGFWCVVSILNLLGFHTLLCNALIPFLVLSYSYFPERPWSRTQLGKRWVLCLLHFVYLFLGNLSITQLFNFNVQLNPLLIYVVYITPLKLQNLKDLWPPLPFHYLASILHQQTSLHKCLRRFVVSSMDILWNNEFLLQAFRLYLLFMLLAYFPTFSQL